MNELQIFTNDAFGEVRTVVKDNEPWFVAADVCKSFGVANSRIVTARLDDDEKGVCDVDTLGGKQTVTIINEAGLYHALFTMEPKNARGISDEAINERIEKLKSFKRWITHEVIPSIRKHGAYMAPNTLTETLAQPENLIVLLTSLQKEQNGRIRAEAKAESLEADNHKLTDTIDKLDKQVVSLTRDNRSLSDQLYKQRGENLRYYIQAAGFEKMMERGTDISLTETAKELGAGRGKMIDMLIRKNYLYRAPSGRLVPCAGRKTVGVFSLKEYAFKNGYRLEPTVYVTIAGRAKILAECIKDGIVQPTLPIPESVSWEV